MWREHQHHQRSKSSGVQRSTPAVEEAGKEKERQHQHGALNRHTHAGNVGIKGSQRDGDERGHPFRRAQPASQPEDGEGQNANVHTRNHQEVVDAGFLKLIANIAQQKRVVADHHGGEQRGIIALPESTCCNVLENTAANSATPGCWPAFYSARQYFNLRGVDGTNGGKPKAMHIGFIVEGAGIAEISGQAKFGREGDALAVSKLGNGN